MITVVLLAACGNDEKVESEEESIFGDQEPQDTTAEDLITLSEAFNQYSMWFLTEQNRDRNSYISAVYVFDSGELTMYDTYDISIEDIANLNR